MSVYSVPEDIRKYKPKGYMVKKGANKYYYVYAYKSITTPEGKRKTKMGSCVGKIVDGVGFIPNDNYIHNQEITTLEYGQYKIILDNTKDIYKMLTDVFAYDDAARIYSMALISFINGFTYLTSYKEYYQQSVLSLEFPQIRMGYTSLSKLVDNLGRRQTHVHAFENKLLEKSSREIAIDGHCIPNYSVCNDLSENGNKFNKFNGAQVNLLMGYDVNTHTPLFQRVYSGSTLDKVSIQDLIEIKEFRNILFIVDRGFYSEKNIRLFSENGNRYIIPLSQNLTIYKTNVTSSSFEQSFLYNEGKKSETIIEYREVKTEENVKVIIYRDKNQNHYECTSYLKDLSNGKKGCSREEYEKLKDYFGLIVLQTNLDDTPETIYKKYKMRWSIETFFNYVSNINHFEALHECDYYQMQGISFIMLITSLIYSEMMNVAKQAKVNKSINTILLESRFLKIHKTKDKWYIQNAKAELRTLFTSFNSPLTNTLSFTYLKN